VHFSAAKIEPSNDMVYSMDSHSIKCVLTDIPIQIKNVAWNTDRSVANLGLAPEDGLIKGTTQTSTLSLSSTQLVKLKEAGPDHKFTCKITVGVSKVEVAATQAVKIYTPGEYMRIQTRPLLLLTY
jgi:hypothetical protein